MSLRISRKAKISQQKQKDKNEWRLTKQRVEIFDFVRKDISHPSADDIYQGVKKDMPNISFGTVYRNLSFLREHGYLKEFTVDKVSHFEARVDSHVHFVCEKCHGIEDIEDTKDTALINELKQTADNNKFIIRSENYEIRGICHQCQAEGQSDKLTPELFCIAHSHLKDDFQNDSPACKECKFSVNCTYVK